MLARARPGAGRCGADPAGLYEFACRRGHIEQAWLCLRHGEQAIAGRPATLCEECAAKKRRGVTLVRLVRLVA